MNIRHHRSLLPLVAIVVTLLIAPGSTAQSPAKSAPPATPAQGGAPSPGGKAELLQFPDGTATSSELCGSCHQAIYREYAEGFGADLQYGEILYEAPSGKKVIGLPAKTSLPSLHAIAGTEPFPIHARMVEEGGQSCNVCHFPQAFEIPDMNKAEIAKPKPPAKAEETGGLTCASCHLTPDGKVRGPYDVKAPHATVRDPKIQTSAMCASCHSLGARVVGKQTQTFLEWREDFSKPGLGRQHC